MDVSISSKNGDVDHVEADHGIKFKEWGFKIERLFEVAYRFYKRNESKVFHPSFDVRNQMNALILQSRFGNYDSGKAPDIGALDLVGKSRRHQWSLLKGMSKAEAMSKFICTLDEICPFFKTYAEAVKISTEAHLQQPNATSNQNRLSDQSTAESLHQIESDEQLQAIQTSLCRQTYDQFKNYAEKQHPNDLPRQKYLISEMQKQYCEKYISRMQPELNRNLISASNGNHTNPSSQAVPEDLSHAQSESKSEIPDIVKAKFESFPEPSQINTLNSRQPSVDTNPPQISGNKSTPVNGTSLIKTSHNDFTSITINCDQSQAPPQQAIISPSLPTQHLPLPPTKEPSSYEISVQEAIPVIDDHQNVDPTEQRQVDTWSCGSSSRSSSPLRQCITYEPLEPATIWTKKNVEEFKASLADDKHGGFYHIKQGTSLIIQVPTYPDGRYIYWEFATDEFDIGFGLDFIHETNLMKPLSLNIYEEIDEDGDDDIDELVGELDSTNFDDPCNSTMEVLERKRKEKFDRVARTISILPTYRRDSHEEVFVGRHRYPGQGYYLLKFDNTYSVLRSKSLSFRICYFI